jgi:hypothetical protein
VRPGTVRADPPGVARGVGVASLKAERHAPGAPDKYGLGPGWVAFIAWDSGSYNECIRVAAA